MPRPFLLLALMLIPLVSQAHEPVTYNRISFSVSTEQDVSNDRMQIIMQAQARGRDLQDLADEVNKAVDWAVTTAKRDPAIEVQTLNYQTSPIYTKGKQDGWRVSQSLSLAGSNINALSKLMGKLQARLQTQSVSYLVSHDRLTQVHEKLTTMALQQFNQRAQQIAAAMNRSQYQIVNISINTGGQFQPRPMMQSRGMLMAEKAVSTPSFEAGEQTVTVTASGVIELSQQ
ncbi:MAG: SIMPL domain-containing protein [Chromatiales bacterium]|jgi:predicted secreted protein